jgi:hypothetical protein
MLDVDLTHGYTLADINRIAASATRHAGTYMCDTADRYQMAWSAIVEHLYAVDVPPAERELWHRGRHAIWAAIRDDRRIHGAPVKDRAAGHGDMPSFRRYWWDHAAVVPSCEERVVERLALRQIWPQLTDGHRSALAAYAAVGTIGGAASALGVSVTAMQSRLQRARVRAAELWHEHETAVRSRRRDYRARTEHDHLRPCGTATAYMRHRRRGETVDDACRSSWTRYQAERAATRGAARGGSVAA